MEKEPEEEQVLIGVTCGGNVALELQSTLKVDWDDKRAAIAQINARIDTLMKALPLKLVRGLDDEYEEETPEPGIGPDGRITPLNPSSRPRKPRPHPEEEDDDDGED